MKKAVFLIPLLLLLITGCKKDPKCPDGFVVEDNKCVHEVERIKAEVSYSCDDDSRLENDTCVRELIQPVIETTGCKEGLTEANGYCTGTLTEKAIDGFKCNSGTYNSKTGKCDELTYVDKATKTCKGELDIVLDNGKCAAAHPGAHSYGDNPAPFDEATECCCGDTFRNGWCYSLPDGNYDATITCPSGSTYGKGSKGNACYTTTATAATPAKTCNAGYTLSGDTCTKTVKEKVGKVLTCEAGYELRTDDCLKVEATPAKAEYHCPDGFNQVGSDCVKIEVRELN